MANESGDNIAIKLIGVAALIFAATFWVGQSNRRAMREGGAVHGRLGRTRYVKLCPHCRRDISGKLTDTKPGMTYPCPYCGGGVSY